MKFYLFKKKPQARNGWINGGFFVFEPKIFDYIDGDHIMLEREPLEKLTKENELVAFKHNGFWQCMDNIRDKEFLTNLWEKWKCTMDLNNDMFSNIYNNKKI